MAGGRVRGTGMPQPRSVLRHRAPMLLIDRVGAVELGRSLDAEWRVRRTWAILGGHFPDEPVVPGVLLVEAIAQASALLAWATEPFEPKRARMYLVSIERARFRLRAEPGDRLAVRTRLVARRGPLWRFDGAVERDGRRVAEAGLTAALFPRGRGEREGTAK